MYLLPISHAVTNVNIDRAIGNGLRYELLQWWYPGWMCETINVDQALLLCAGWCLESSNNKDDDTLGTHNVWNIDSET